MSLHKKADLILIHKHFFLVNNKKSPVVLSEKFDILLNHAKCIGIYYSILH